MKHTTCCLSVFVRFNKAHLQGQHVRVSNGPTATQYIRVEHDAIRVSLSFCNAAGMVLRELSFSSPDVVELDCENVCEPEAERPRRPAARG
jgi:hypothetical protein